MKGSSMLGEKHIAAQTCSSLKRKGVSPQSVAMPPWTFSNTVWVAA
jgi:hypothetical protein